MRILVTGSRDWRGRWAVDDAICDVLTEHPLERGDVTVVHGGCATGADLHATYAVRRINAWFTAQPVKLEIHEAEWDRLGKAAGPIRNQTMVDLGADICLTFIRNGSRGATHCATAAERAGIPVRQWTA